MTQLFLIISIILLYIIYNIDKKLDRPFPSPGLIACFVVELYYLLPSFLNVINPDLSLKNRSYYGYSIEIYEDTALIGIISFISLYASYYISMRKIKINYKAALINKIEILYKKINDHKIINYSFVLILIGISASLYKQYLGLNHYSGILSVHERGVDVTNRTLTWITYLTIFGLGNLIFMYKKNKIRGFKKIIFYMAIIFEFINSILSGGAASLIQLFFPFFVFYFYEEYFIGENSFQYKRSNVFTLKNFIFFTIFISTAFILKESVRSLQSENFDISLIGILNATFNYSFLEILSIGYSKAFGENLIATLTGADSMAVIITRLNTGYQQFELGSTLSLIFVSLVPRFLYTEKPDIALGMWFTDNYWRNLDDVLIVGTGTQSTAFLLPGEFYINFGIIGVIIGMLIHGFIIAYVTRILFNSEKRIGICGFSYIVMLLFPLVHHLYSFASYFSTLASLFMLNTFLLIFFRLLMK